VKIYTFFVAPNPTRVRVYVREKGIALDEILVNLREGEQKSEEHLARNPFGNLPVLELDDGSHLTESLAIIEYLEELYPDPPMIGIDPLSRARVRSLERIIEVGVLFPTARLVHSTNSPLDHPPNPAIAEDARASLPIALGVLDERIADHPFVAGADPTIADCTLFAALNFGRFFGVELDPGYTHISRWFDAFCQRPSVQS
jgi:glutathione S-transferase